MTSVVVLGGGIGGISVAYDLHGEFGGRVNITLISNKDYFQFTPSNPWVGVNLRERKDIVIQLAPLLEKKKIGFHATGAKRVLPEQNRIELANGQHVDYDYLVIATGPDLAFDEIDGLGPVDGHTQSVCTVDHAVQAAEAWETFCADPGPIVVGAVQGASCFGPAYEHAMIMENELRKRKIRDRVPMTFVTSEPYIGHLGLGGVGDTKTMIESEMRHRHIKWITNAKVNSVEKGQMHVTEVDEDGTDKRQHDLEFGYSMMLPAFRGIPAVFGIDGLTNPRGFILVDEHQSNPKFPNIFGVGVCIAIPPHEPTPVPVGVPKTGYMIESMSSAAVMNIKALIEGREASTKATWNALCMADFGNIGIAFVAMPQIPPRNVNWSSDGKWVHLAKIAFEKYYLRKVKQGSTDPVFERQLLKLMGMYKLKE